MFRSLEKVTGKRLDMTNRIVNQKAELFSDRILKLHKYLMVNKKEAILSKQILRSGTSVGANLAEAECASSRKDFISKNYIAFKEINETMFWLRKLLSGQYIKQTEFISVYKDAEEIKKILTKILKTLNSQ